jgi:hypothetical protein
MPLPDRSADGHGEFAVSFEECEPPDDLLDLDEGGLLTALVIGLPSRGFAFGEGLKDRNRITRVAVERHPQRQPRKPGRLEAGHAAEITGEHLDAHLSEAARPHLLRVAGPTGPVASDDLEPVPV